MGSRGGIGHLTSAWRLQGLPFPSRPSLSTRLHAVAAVPAVPAVQITGNVRSVVFEWCDFMGNIATDGGAGGCWSIGACWPIGVGCCLVLGAGSLVGVCTQVSRRGCSSGALACTAAGCACTVLNTPSSFALAKSPCTASQPTPHPRHHFPGCPCLPACLPDCPQ